MRPGVILFRLAVHVSIHCHEYWPCLLIEAVGKVLLRSLKKVTKNELEFARVGRRYQLPFRC